MLAAKSRVARRLWSSPSCCLAAAAFSNLMPCLAMNAMNSAVGWTPTLFVYSQLTSSIHGAALPGRGDPGPGPLAKQLALELGDLRQHAVDQPPRTPALSSRWAVCKASRTDRPRRSTFQTASVSPARNRPSSPASAGLWRAAGRLADDAAFRHARRPQRPLEAHGPGTGQTRARSPRRPPSVRLQLGTPFRNATPGTRPCPVTSATIRSKSDVSKN